MPKDFINDDEFGMEECEEVTQRNPVSRTSNTANKGGLTTLKDYVIVGLLSVIIFMGFNNYIFARTNPGGGFGAAGGGGGCGGCSGGGAAVSTEELRQVGLEYYVANYNDTEVEAKVEDFGCHQEVHIYKDGQLIKKIGYGNGQVYEIAL
ncbi:MAG: hypothetical protein KGZ63_06720 [Clostridiales bacterium]|jgi:hypothetical protein|nr:hypothetical protein [Clostridiales bacterium]